MIQAGGGAIVNTASQWGLYPAPAHIAYNVSEALVVAFTKNLARDYAPHNIRVNAVAPGEVQTPMHESGLAKTGTHRGRPERPRSLWPHWQTGGNRRPGGPSSDRMRRRVPGGPLQGSDPPPWDVAEVIAFLASGKSRHSTGATIDITGADYER